MAVVAAVAWEKAARSLLDRAERDDWIGNDPYDGLGFDWPKFFTDTKTKRQVITQVLARSPINPRRYLPRPSVSRPIPKTLALYGSACAHLVAGGHTDLSGQLEDITSHLIETRSDMAWGYPWDVQTRWSFYPAGSNNIIVTSFAVKCLQDASKVLDVTYDKVLDDATDWIAEKLFNSSGGFFTYHPSSRVLVHNANLMGANAVFSVRKSSDTMIERAVESSLKGQLSDGSFPYGDGASLRWVDSFHTGYVLEALAGLKEIDPSIEEALEKGMQYYLHSFFDEQHRPSLYPGKRYPLDAHSGGTAISTLTCLAGEGYLPFEYPKAIADAVVDTFVTRSGTMHRKYRVFSNRIHYVRWCSAPIALGLARLCRALKKQNRSACGGVA